MAYGPLAGCTPGSINDTEKLSKANSLQLKDYWWYVRCPGRQDMGILHVQILSIGFNARHIYLGALVSKKNGILVCPQILRIRMTYEHLIFGVAKI